MKTLLLSLVGIVGTASSSIVPTIMMNNHQNINKIRTVTKEVTKDFSYKLDTNYNYGKVLPGYNLYNKEFEKFIDELKTFLEDNTVGVWSIYQITSKLGASEKEGKRDVSQLTEFNETLHKMVDIPFLTNIRHYLVIYGPYKNNEWGLAMDASVQDYQGREYHLVRFFGYTSDDRFTDEEVLSGLTNTITIKYNSTAPEETSFKYDLNTDYENIKAGTYDHSKAFRNFINELKKYMIDNVVYSWEIVEVKSKLNGLETEWKLNDEYAKNLNKALHANKIDNVKQWAEIDDPYEQGKWSWFLKGSLEGDGEKYSLSHLDGYSRDERYDNETIRSGFTNTITVKCWY